MKLWLNLSDKTFTSVPKIGDERLLLIVARDMDREIRVPEPLWEDLPGFARHSAMFFRHVPIGLGGLFVDMDQPFAVGLETSPFILTRKEMGVFAELREHLPMFLGLLFHVLGDRLIVIRQALMIGGGFGVLNRHGHVQRVASSFGAGNQQAYGQNGEKDFDFHGFFLAIVVNVKLRPKPGRGQIFVGTH